MCGITGILAFNEIGSFYMINMAKSIDTLSKRGPDSRGSFVDDFIGLGHRRLSVIDVSSNARQPMTDESGRYVIVYNGEIFNYRQLRKELENKGVVFKSESDTEVLLYHYIKYGKEGLNDLNGFFAFAVYDKEEKSLFLARDRFGIKPLLFYYDEDKFIFSSEMKALTSYNIPKSLDYHSLYQYFHFNYIPSPNTIFQDVYKLDPGHYLTVRNRQVENKVYYKIPYEAGKFISLDYEGQKKQLGELLEDAVKSRLVSDVPLGSFLSGGIDSSVITALAARHTDKLHTFSIGYKDEPFFDESNYAKLVANKLGTEHTIFSLTNDTLFEHVDEVLSYMDEPFADSSALAMYMLSKYTSEEVKVALSGDGADELFAGYNKHFGDYKIRKGGTVIDIIQKLGPLWHKLPSSRSTSFGNKVRQLQKLADGCNMSVKDRYYTWAGFTKGGGLDSLFTESTMSAIDKGGIESRKGDILKYLKEDSTVNDILRSDMDLVLVSDMLHKVDMMSMAHGLEVRVPFLDHRVVDFAFSLPEESKIDKKMKKKILQDTYRDILPKELYNRPKHGFEVPLLKWFRKEMKSLIVDDLLSKEFIEEQDIFDPEEIERLKQQLFSSNPGDVHARIWAIVVFQYWWKKYF
ncbi:asparagine synthase (glutamine-hydrolyzing) [Cytophagaceae bacterium ABcell3]|nr:asparagine synthase (glutamine-hydrolyzing) [Cytophagaceae bacterium ABcell3]